MILIGQYDSPFVRRVGIAMTLYGMAFEHRPWSTFAEAEKIRPHNPLTRVPTLVLDDGTALVESFAILDYLDGRVPPAAALAPREEPRRHRCLRIASLACGAAEKAVSLFYERRLHKEVSDVWSTRCRQQVLGTLDLLEKERAATAGTYWLGAEISHADIALACAWRFTREAHPGLVAQGQCPHLERDAAHLEATPAFRTIAQTFIPPA